MRKKNLSEASSSIKGIKTKKSMRLKWKLKELRKRRKEKFNV